MFEPDLVVTARDSTEPYVVVEVKLDRDSLLAAEEPMREYMVRNNFALGMLVAPGEMRLYRNRFSSYESDGVERIGVYPFDGLAAALSDERLGSTSESAARRTAHRLAAILETAVEHWLQTLPHADLSGANPELRRVLQQEFAPYVRDGVVRAAHQRFPTLRASDGRHAS